MDESSIAERVIEKFVIQIATFSNKWPKCFIVGRYR